MSDIVERLRDYAPNGSRPWIGIEAVFTDAAAEIESLRSTVKRIQYAAKTIMIGEADELSRLREGAREAHLAKLTLDSEREANARLTEELARAERNRDMWKGQCEQQATKLRAWQAWYSLATANDDCEYLNGGGWADAAELATGTRTALSSYREAGE